MKRIHIVLLLIPISMVVMLGIQFYRLLETDDDDLATLEQHLGYQFDDVDNFEADFKVGRLYYICLRFSARPERVMAFAEAVCTGRLHTGYDPFNAVNQVADDQHMVLIKADGMTSYSYSPDTPAEILGNYCQNPGTRLIRIDTSDATQYHVRFEENGGFCGGATVDVPYAADATLVLFRGFPLQVAGLKKTPTGFSLVTQDLCFEAGFSYTFSPAGYDWLIGATVIISIDGETVRQTIGDGWYFASQVTGQDACFYRETWQPGEYEVSFFIEPIARAPQQRSFWFSVPD